MAIPQVGLPEAWPRRGSHLILEAQRLGFWKYLIISEAEII